MPDYQMGSGTGGGGSQSVQGPSFSQPSFSPQVANQSLGGGDPAAAPDYSGVGKLGFNFGDPSQNATGNAAPPEDHGGFFAGILGAVGGTFGEGGRAVGETAGKVLEVPVGLLGGALGAAGGVGLPLGSQIMGAIGGGLEATGLTQHGQAAPTIVSDVASSFSGAIDPKTGQRGNVTIGGTVMGLLTSFGLLGRAVERKYAEGSLVAGGEGVNMPLLARREALPKDLKDQLDSGAISASEALDQLVMRGAGYSDNPIVNIAMSVGLDPMTIATLGVGLTGKAVAATEKISRAAQIAGELGTGEKYRAAEALTHITATGDMAGLQLSRLEHLGLATIGRVPGFEEVVVPVANQITRLTDPLKLFGGGNIGKRSTEHVAMAVSAGMTSAFKPFVVRKVSGWVGEDLTNRLLGLHGTNILNRVFADDAAAEAMKAGEVPLTLGENGFAMTPTQGALAMSKSGAVDKNVGALISTMIEKQKPFLAHLTPVAMREETIAKVAEMGGDVSKVGAKVSYDEAAFVHSLYYDHMASKLVDDVVPALKAVADLPADIIPERLTVVAERTFTAQRLPELEAALKAEDGPAVRRIIREYDDFNHISGGLIPTEKNPDLFDAMARWIETNRGGLLHEVPLTDAATGVLRSDLPDALARWADKSQEFGYRLALAPPVTADPSLLFRVTRDEAGRILHARPWLEYTSEVMNAQVPGRMQALRSAMFTQIRTDRILWQTQRAFVRSIATDGLSENAGRAIYRKIMYVANEAGMTPRGLDPSQMYSAAKDAMRAYGGKLPANLTEKQIVNHLLVAFRGDLSQVGITQAITGAAKARLPGAASNFWGGLAEHLYPMAKFKFAPWFMTQEYVEPYILNRMRGVSTPLRKGTAGFQEALALRNAFHQVTRSSVNAEGAVLEMAEYQNMLKVSTDMVHEVIGKRGNAFSRIAGGTWGDISLRKQAAEGLLIKKVFGQNLKKAFNEMRGPEHWQEMERHYQTMDAGDIAFNWMAENFHVAGANGERIGSMADLVNPMNIGQSTRIVLGEAGPGRVTWMDLAGWLGRKGETADADLMASLKDGSLSREDFVAESTTAGIDPIFSHRAFDMATGPEVKDFWNQYQKTFMRSVKGATAKAQETAAHRALVQVRAMSMGITEEEFIKTHFADLPEQITTAKALAGVDHLAEIRQDITRQIVERHGGSLEKVQAAIGDVGKVAVGKETFRSRVATAFLDRTGAVSRSVIPELDDASAGEHLFNHLAAAEPDRLRIGGNLPPDMLGPDRRLVESAITRATDEVPTATTTYGAGKTLHRVGLVTAGDLKEQALSVLDSGEGLAAGSWYTDMRQRFVDLFGNLSDPFIHAFAVSQASNSPVRGMANVLHTVEQLFADGFESRALAATGEGEQLLMAASRRVATPAGIVRRTGQLNENNIVKALINAPINGHFGAKLNDFLDSMLGNTSRRWTGRGANLQPAAIDRWTARDMGLVDGVAMNHIIKTAPQSALGDGLFQIGDKVVRPSLPVRGQFTKFDLVDRSGNLIDKQGNVVDKAVSALDFTGAPSDAQYERGVRLMNEAKDAFNTHVNPDGTLGVWGRVDWTAADVQAVGWVRTQKVMGGNAEGMEAFTKNSATIATEVSAESGSDWEKFGAAFDTLTPDASARVTGRMNTWLAGKIRDLTGATSVVTDWVGPARWKGGSRTVSASSIWLGSPEMGDNIADITSLAFRQREVWNPHAASFSAFNPAIHHPIVDLVHPATSDMVKAKATLSAIADALDAPGSTLLKDGDGNLVLRVIDRPFPGDAPFFDRVTQGTRHAKVGMADDVKAGAKYDAAIRKAGFDPTTFDALDIAHGDVYIAGPRIRATAADIQKAYDAGDTELGQRLQREVGAAAGGSVESGGAIKSTGGALSDLAWETHVEDAAGSIGRRGGRLDATALGGLRDEATSELRDALHAEGAGAASRAADVGTPLLDRRAGHVLGYTRRVADDPRVVIGALKAADPVTGLHELAHVFATDLDQSARDLVIAARRTAINADRTDLSARIAAAEAKQAAAKSPRSAGRYGAQAAALRHDLGEFTHDETWGVQHEEWFVDQFHRWVRGSDAPAGLENSFQHFRNWIEKVWDSIKGKTTTPEVSPAMKGLFDDMFKGRGRVPTVNYSIEQQALRMAGKQALISAQDEAFTTQYFKQGRSFMERSINHPFLGMYPFSYMWGKILPELFRFTALRPFGFEAPMLGWNALREVSDTVSSQQQLDPGFADFMKANRDSFSVVNSIFPALPNEVPFGNSPLWARRIAEQGLQNADRQAQGRPQTPIDYGKGLGDSAIYSFGPATAIKQFSALLGSAGDVGRRVAGMPNPGDKPATATVAAPLGMVEFNKAVAPGP